MLATRDARVIHFPVGEVNILAGVGKGVMGIKLDDDDVCLGGALIGSRFDALTLETSGGKTHECRRGAYQQVGRGGKGYEVLKRASFTRVIPPPIELVNWDEVEGKNGKAKDADKRGDGTLFG
jgi:DNA gyrase subunit A